MNQHLLCSMHNVLYTAQLTLLFILVENCPGNQLPQKSFYWCPLGLLLFTVCLLAAYRSSLRSAVNLSKWVRGLPGQLAAGSVFHQYELWYSMYFNRLGLETTYGAKKLWKNAQRDETHAMAATDTPGSLLKLQRIVRNVRFLQSHSPDPTNITAYHHRSYYIVLYC